MVAPILPYTATRAEHSQPGVDFFLADEDHHEPAREAWHRGTTPSGAAARAEAENRLRLRATTKRLSGISSAIG
jgi:hypothetical protein